jgi:large subunit ribosomal protein L17
MLANMVTSLFQKERITTTDAKAKEARRAAERLITRAKKGYAAYQDFQSLKDQGKDAEAKQMQAVALAHWRQASRVVKDAGVLKKLFDEIAPQYMERPGGYTRILHLRHRLGDNAKTVLLELVGTEVTSEPMTKKSRRKAEPEGDEAAAEATPQETKPKKKSSKKKKEDKEAKAEAKAKPAEAEAQAQAEEAEAESPQEEEKPDK